MTSPAPAYVAGAAYSGSDVAASSSYAALPGPSASHKPRRAVMLKGPSITSKTYFVPLPRHIGSARGEGGRALPPCRRQETPRRNLANRVRWDQPQSSASATPTSASASSSNVGIEDALPSAVVSAAEALKAQLQGSPSAKRDLAAATRANTIANRDPSTQFGEGAAARKAHAQRVLAEQQRKRDEEHTADALGAAPLISEEVESDIIVDADPEAVAKAAFELAPQLAYRQPNSISVRGYGSRAAASTRCFKGAVGCERAPPNFRPALRLSPWSKLFSRPHRRSSWVSSCTPRPQTSCPSSRHLARSRSTMAVSTRLPRAAADPALPSTAPTAHPSTTERAAAQTTSPLAHPSLRLRAMCLRATSISSMSRLYPSLYTCLTWCSATSRKRPTWPLLILRIRPILSPCKSMHTPNPPAEAATAEGDAATASPTELVATKPRDGQSDRELNRIYSFLSNLVSQLLSHKANWAFQRPMSVEFEQFAARSSRPVDLFTIRDSLAARRYGSQHLEGRMAANAVVTEFEDDLSLLYSNARHFFGVRSTQAECVEQPREIQPLLPQRVQAHAGERAAAQGVVGRFVRPGVGQAVGLSKPRFAPREACRSAAVVGLLDAPHAQVESQHACFELGGQKDRRHQRAVGQCHRAWDDAQAPTLALPATARGHQATNTVHVAAAPRPRPTKRNKLMVRQKQSKSTSRRNKKRSKNAKAAPAGTSEQDPSDVDALVEAEEESSVAGLLDAEPVRKRARTTKAARTIDEPEPVINASKAKNTRASSSAPEVVVSSTPSTPGRLLRPRKSTPSTNEHDSIPPPKTPPRSCKKTTIPKAIVAAVETLEVEGFEVIASTRRSSRQRKPVNLD
ncbi:hypothetical protein L1887_49513 [Cichorium endivia]|nr:hypothetical protein L1887_49513 [Cichorium endivia]